MEKKELETDQESAKAFNTAKEKTQLHMWQLWGIVAQYSRIEALSKSKPASHPQPKHISKYSSAFIKLLTAVPYVLGLTFAVSFFWDFNGISTAFWGLELQFEGLLRIVSVSGLIGFFTNWLAITMLFKPAQKRPILGHGLIPAQKNRIAFRLAKAVSDDLINPEIIKQKINESDAIGRYREQATKYIKSIIDDPQFRADLKEWIIAYLDEMIADPEIRGALAKHILIQIEEAIQEKSFEKVALKAYSFVKGQEMQKIIEESLKQIPISVEDGLDTFDELLDQLPQKIDKHSDAIEDIVTSLLYKLINQLDVHKLVEENMRSYDEQHIANIIRSATNEQLRYIQYLGAVLGFIGGFIIWEPLLSTIVLTLLAGGLLLFDYLIYRHSAEF